MALKVQSLLLVLAMKVESLLTSLKPAAAATADDNDDDDDDDTGGMAKSGFIAGVGYVACDQILAVTLLTIGWAIGGLIEVGPVISVLDISAQHTGHYFENSRLAAIISSRLRYLGT